MTLKEMNQAMSRVADNLAVQGQLLHRLETDMEASRRDFDVRIDAVLGIVEKDREQMRLMQVAMAQLFEHMDRFIRGLESDGQQKSEE
jgi:hypothetical protein